MIYILCRGGEVCSHVATILFKVEACVRLEIAKKTCTELPCVWNQKYSENVSNNKIVTFQELSVNIGFTTVYT